ncbi:L-rhamnose mutarotase [Weizmannia acidilactici]|uniref:L-rhamnose mutarotase n=1 Tax=Weizmannia acidilactici TaxID=2607726 RepID=A0A5J4JGD7_9BACI|nr:L-rhamnose mutarotase [Weizmannia acidilactici]GER65795.1 L-rhamnose mutarotase [Weizmannia acidilactici]GER71143.1 L-rhamnose mutarotase [Weizmannia acidilactici]GER74856.1 L-rhamnose mutarotase [Weizmannia acidilactici]
MVRLGSIMYLKKEYYDEYKKRHDQLWPEMKEALKAHGASNYSIFLNEDNGELFAYVEVEDPELYGKMGETEACKKWWAYMDPLMETNPDNSPVTKELKEVFHLD